LHVGAGDLATQAAGTALGCELENFHARVFFSPRPSPPPPARGPSSGPETVVARSMRHPAPSTTSPLGFWRHASETTPRSIHRRLHRRPPHPEPGSFNTSRVIGSRSSADFAGAILSSGLGGGNEERAARRRRVSGGLRPPSRSTPEPDRSTA